MSKCKNCGAEMAQGDIFCRSCGTKHDPNQQQAAPEKSSLFLKYSGYLDTAALFNVACAKENGIVKSDFPNEAEVIYEHLAIKNHTESMFRYAMIQMNKQPPNKAEALKWLRLAAEKGHEPSNNYLKTHEPTPLKASVSSGNQGNVLSGEDIYEAMQNAAVEIIAMENERSSARSSGFIISNNGFVITNAHAILDEHGNVCKNISVKLGDKVMPAAPVAFGAPADGRSDNLDIALLFIPGVKLTDHAVLGDSDSCRNGQKVYLIGNSLGSGICITSGIISDSTREMSGLSYPYIMTDAAANHGNSGGPLLNEQGEVIGVLVAGIENAEGMNYAIPINMVKGFLSYLMSQTKLDSKIMGDLLEGYDQAATKSLFTDKLFTGIHLVVDIISFILSIL